MRFAWRRHQLAWLDDEGWRHAAAAAGQDEALLEALGHWRTAALPWVVTRQSRGWAGRPDASDQDVASLAIGLPLPGRWARRRVAAVVPESGVAAVGHFPSARSVAPLVAAPRRAAWSWLCDALDALEVGARVHGSHGWQALTGLDHVTRHSDLDLHLEVDAPGLADEVAAVLATATGLATDEETGRPWLDGELVFPDGAAVAWREWRIAREPGPRQAREVLVKRLQGVALEPVDTLGQVEAGGAAGDLA